DVRALGDIRLSANWMAAAGHASDDYTLYKMVEAVGEELCPKLGIAIPVGKDSLSMRTVWQADGRERSVTSPVSLIVSAFAPVGDVRRTLTPELDRTPGSKLVLVDLGRGHTRLGGSCLAQTFGQFGGEPPDLDDANDLVAFFAALRELKDSNLVQAYHDRSDGGVFVTLAEMAFAANVGLDVSIPDAVDDAVAWAFAEELGAVMQIADEDLPAALNVLAAHGLAYAEVAA